MMRIMALAVAGLLLAWGAHAQDGQMNPAQTERYHDLIDELRCVICQNQTIAESKAPLAQDMRELVRRQILDGRSNEQIKDYLVERYGEWVLYRPRFEPTTWALWLGPGALLLVALATALVLWRRAGRRAEPPPPDRDAIARVLDDEGNRKDS